MGYCKECFEHIDNDCILSNGLCVFCFYKINEWESNGKRIAKKDAITNLERSFLVWRNYYLNYYRDIKKAIRNSPKGIIRRRKIKNHFYYYLVYREGAKVKTEYCGKKLPLELSKGIALRQQLVRKLSRIKSLLYSLRISERPAQNISRFSIFKRDNFTCQYCGKTVKDGIKLHVDHMIPLIKGGSNNRTNLITSCQKCNSEKRDKYH